MGQFYEVQFTKRLDGADSYGNVTDSVKFTNEGESVLWSHQPSTVIEQGMKVYGRIDDLVSKNGKPYRKFKREQQEQGFTPTPSSSGTDSGKYSKGSNNDGMRQGMSINNATTLIEAFIKTGAYTNTDPKQVVADLANFAREIYKIDLAEKEQKVDDVVVDVTESQEPFNLDDIENIFPAPVNGMGPR